MRPATARTFAVIVAGISVFAPASARDPDPRTVALRFTPTKRAQLALWIEKADGTFVKTVRLTQSVAFRGIGNRPGSSQMNSGYRWPYGRREGVLPVWASRRAGAPGAMPWKRVIFQDRTTEGLASRTSNDASPDSYFCLSFDGKTTRKDGLDAVTCASAFSSDKGRYITEADVAAGYAEPQESEARAPVMFPLSLHSLYPPRRDVKRCTSGSCDDRPDVDRFDPDARAVMPDLDAVTMATPTPDVRQEVLFTVPPDWAEGNYVALIEINTEGDYNGVWNDKTYPTPVTPKGAWDSWAMDYGYPFRGQPSVVYRVPFKIGESGITSTRDPAGYGSLSGQGPTAGTLNEMDGRMTVDAASAPGSGGDRLRLAGSDTRFEVEVRSADFCAANAPPGPIESLAVSNHADEKHTHEWGHLSFVFPTDDKGVSKIEVRVGTQPITDEASFMRAQPALAATVESMELVLPKGTAGTRIDVDFGGLIPLGHYHVGIRAVDVCNQPGPIAVAELQTTKIRFTQLSGCFIATAAFGSPLAAEIGGLRRLRDRHLETNPVGSAFVGLYERAAPVLAAHLAPHEGLRASVREILGPLVAITAAIR